jgi:hypothetical protein
MRGVQCRGKPGLDPGEPSAMQVIRSVAFAAFLGACLHAVIPTAHAQVSIGFSINFEPPPLPVYEQSPSRAAPPPGPSAASRSKCAPGQPCR